MTFFEHLDQAVPEAKFSLLWSGQTSPCLPFTCQWTLGLPPRSSCGDGVTMKMGVPTQKHNCWATGPLPATPSPGGLVRV